MSTPVPKPALVEQGYAVKSATHFHDKASTGWVWAFRIDLCGSPPSSLVAAAGSSLVGLRCRPRIFAEELASLLVTEGLESLVDRVAADG